MTSNTPDIVSQSWSELRSAVAQPQTWLNLARIYVAEELHWQAGYAARQAVRLDAKLRPALQALQIDKWQDINAGDAMLGWPRLDNAQAFASTFNLWLDKTPGDWLTWLYLARLQEMIASQPNLPAAGYAQLQAVKLEPIPGETQHWLGVWRLNAGDAKGAIQALSELLNIRPVRCGSMMYLGEALLRNNNIDAAEKAFARASLSNNPDFLLSLANKVFTYNYWQEAIAVLQKGLSIQPDNLALNLTLAKIYWEVYELTKAQAACRRVLALDPGNKEVTYMLAGLFGRMGDARQHYQAVQKEYQNRDDPLSRLASSVAMVSLYHDELSASEVADLHRSVCAPIEAAMEQKHDFNNDRSSNRRLRIGYVTGDLHRQHPVNIFMLPVLLRHNHEQFDIHIYHTGQMHDGYTHLSKNSADHWLEAGALDDHALQKAIIADQIDVLVDLAGHTSSHRLGVFALRAAPVQATFLGYPHSTGLAAIDWLIGDRVVSPAEHAHLFSEGLAQLPGSVFCWASVDDYPLPLPRPANASVVFGSFNNAMKLSPYTVALWARILKAVPDALLLLKAPSLRDDAVRARFTQLFAEQGIPAERLRFRGPTGLAEMMQEYGDIDIALDPTPYNGGTTTLQALWMGVPVVTLAGGNFVGRMGASFMTSLGHPEWVAQNAEQYVEIASQLAQDIRHWRARRAVIRTQMAASPLCDIESYVNHFETLLQQMWAVYCSGKAPRVLQMER